MTVILCRGVGEVDDAMPFLGSNLEIPPPNVNRGGDSRVGLINRFRHANLPSLSLGTPWRTLDDFCRCPEFARCRAVNRVEASLAWA